MLFLPLVCNFLYPEYILLPVFLSFLNSIHEKVQTDEQKNSNQIQSPMNRASSEAEFYFIDPKEKLFYKPPTSPNAPLSSLAISDSQNRLSNIADSTTFVPESPLFSNSDSKSERQIEDSIDVSLYK